LIKKYKDEQNDEKIKEIYEAFFIFAGMWSYGASLDEDKLTFSNQWKGAAKVKFPDQGQNVGQCFDYFFDPLTASWIHWDT
jgi:dynein heavy chain